MKLHTRVLSMLLVLMLLLSTVVACSNPGTPSTTTTTIEITTTTPGTSDSGTSDSGTSAPGTSDSGSSEPEPSTPVLATGVTLNKSETTINKGETETLTATVAPADTTDKTVVWTSSDEAVATVADGVVTAVAVGTATITATTANGLTATCTVTVVISATEISLNKSETTIEKGNTETLTATILPPDTTDTTIVWTSSNEDVATVDGGVVTAVAAGTATITATVNGHSATCTVTVAVPATGVSLNKSETTINKGNTETLTATLEPADATSATTWTSSDENVATVADGVVTAVGAGTATISVTANGFTASCTVTVLAPATGVSLNKNELFLNVDDTDTLVATILPADTTDTATWTSDNEAVATVVDGVVTAIGAGETTITITINGLTATCTVKVIAEATSVELNKTSTTIDKGLTETLTATIAPVGAEGGATWTSSDENVATVDQNGVVTAVDGGTATITVTTLNGLTATCTVTVNVRAESVSVAPGTLALLPGGTGNLTATVLPENTNDKTVSWESDNEAVATVADGVVTAVSVGTATITVTTENGKTATCTVTVIPEATEVSLNKTTTTIIKGDTEPLTATALPDNAGLGAIWTSSDEAVATVDQNGVVTAVEAGTATITVTTLNGLTATCEVTVNGKDASGLVYAISGDGFQVIDYQGTGEDVTIPATYAGKAVLSIAVDAFADCGHVTSLIVPSSITSFESGVFTGLTGLANLTIPFVGQKLDGTGNVLFGFLFGASANSEHGTKVPATLKTVTVTGGTSIGGGAFKGCASIEQIYLPDTITTIGASAFANCSALKSMILPANITALNDYVLLGCTKLATVEIGSKVTAINKNVFQDCKALTELVIPNSVKTIAYAAFKNCTGLVKLTVGSGVTSIATDAFTGCTALKQVHISDLAKWCGITFTNQNSNPLFPAKGGIYMDGAAVTELVIPTTVTTITANAFKGWMSLTSVTFHENVTAIGQSSFANTGLTSVNVPGSVATLSNYAFFQCYSLATVTLNEGLTAIGEYAFDSADIATITIPSTVTSIGKCAFRYCSKLTSFTFAETTGWWYAGSASATSGTEVDVTNTSALLTLMTENATRYWKRTVPTE